MRMQLTFTAGDEYQIVTTAAEKMHITCQKHEPLTMYDVVYYFITKLKSNICTNLITIEKITVLPHTHKHDCTSTKCIFKWNTSVTSHKWGTFFYTQSKPLPRSTADSSVSICNNPIEEPRQTILHNDYPTHFETKELQFDFRQGI